MPGIGVGISLMLKTAKAAYGPELNTNANAASDPNGNETDATTGFSESGLNGTGANVFESQSVVKNVGSYALEADCNDTPTSSARFYMDLSTLGLSNGDQVKIEFDIRHVGTGIFWDARLGSDGGLIANATQLIQVSNTDITFQTVVHEFTYSANTRYFGCRELNGLNNGGVYLDNLSIRKK